MKSKVVASSIIRREVRRDLSSLIGNLADIIYITDWKSNNSLKRLKDAEVLIPLHEEVDDELLNYTPKLRLVARLGVGYDRIDVKACTEHGVYVTYTPNVLSNAVAELTLGLMLCLSRRIIEADRYVRTEWARAGRPTLPLREDLYGKTLGIIGLGRIGTEVARRAKAFGMKIVYYDKVRKPEIEGELGITFLSLNRLLETSDFISIHVPLTPETHMLIGEKELRKMKKTAYIINTSRGKVIDEKSLVKALREQWIAGAGLDVFTVEPLPLNSPLAKMDNVVLTPHMGTHTVETRRLMISKVAEDIRRVLTGKPPLNPVPEQRGKIFPMKNME